MAAVSYELAKSVTTTRVAAIGVHCSRNCHDCLCNGLKFTARTRLYKAATFLMSTCVDTVIDGPVTTEDLVKPNVSEALWILLIDTYKMSLRCR